MPMVLGKKLQQSCEQFDKNVGLVWQLRMDKIWSEQCAMVTMHMLYLLEEKKKTPYWCKVAFVVELHAGRAVQIPGYRFQGQQHI